MGSRKRVKSESNEDDFSKMEKRIKKEVDVKHEDDVNKEDNFNEDEASNVRNDAKMEDNSPEDETRGVENHVKKEMESHKKENKKESNKKKGNKKGNKSVNIKVEPNNGDTNNASPVFSLSNYEKIMFKNLPRWHEISKDNEEEEQSDNINNNMIKEENDYMDEGKKFDSGCKNAHFTDTLITTNDNRIFGVHSLIIMAGSQVLKDMLMKSTEKELNLQDVSGAELTWLLAYMYEGRVELSDEQEQKRMEELVHQFGMITAPSSAEIVHPGTETKDASVYDELRKGGVLKIGKGGKCWKCLECGRDFSKISHAKRHYEVRHTKPDPSQFACPMCGRNNSHQCYLDEHLRLKHGLKKKDLKALKTGQKMET